MTATLEARQLTKSFVAEGGTVDALRDVDVTVGAGEFVAVTGPSGSGKSTLLHLFGGLDTASSGQVLLDGEDLAGLSRDALADVRNRRLGFVFQFFNLLPALTVEENVTLPALIAGRRSSAVRRTVDHLLEVVGLGDKRRRFPSQLSGGEQQRVAIARALVMAPAVVLADEPTGNLDSASGHAVLELLQRCHAGGQTIVLVTHDMRVASQTERVLFLRDGALIDQTPLKGDRRPAVTDLLQFDED